MKIIFDWDHASYLGGFVHNGVSYDHYINTQTDKTYLIREDKKVMFKVDANATMFDEDTKIIGKFRTIGNNWIFQEKNGPEWDHKCGSDLLLTERMMMRFLIK